MTTTEITPEQQEEADEKFAAVIDGFNRAVEWIRKHRPGIDTGFSIKSNGGEMVEISFGCCFSSSPKRQKAIESLFAGREVKRSTDSSGDETYTLVDEASGVAFRWHVFSAKVIRSRETETVTL